MKIGHVEKDGFRNVDEEDGTGLQTWCYFPAVRYGENGTKVYASLTERQAR